MKNKGKKILSREKYVCLEVLPHFVTKYDRKKELIFNGAFPGPKLSVDFKFRSNRVDLFRWLVEFGGCTDFLGYEN